MKTQSLTKKMVLNKVSIADLNQDLLAEVKGGATSCCIVPSENCVDYSELGDVCPTMGLLVCPQDPELP